MLMGYLDLYAVNARHGMVISSARMAILESEYEIERDDYRSENAKVVVSSQQLAGERQSEEHWVEYKAGRGYG
jgi:hypothetical protein